MKVNKMNNRKLEREQEILKKKEELLNLFIEDLNDKENGINNYTHDYDNFCCNLKEMFEEWERFYYIKEHGGVFRELRRVE